MTHYRWVITARIFLITFVNFVDRSAVSFVIGPFKEEFHFSDTQFGMILSAFGVGYIFSTVLGGWLIDRYGARRVWPLAAIGWSMCIGLFGLAGGFWGFISLRFLLGVSEGPHFPALGRTISDWLPAGERARALSLGLVAVPLSSVIGAPFCSYLVADWGWRAMFFVLSALGILWGFVWYALFRDKPADSPFVGKKERQLIRASQAPVKTQSRSDWRFILTHPALIANNIAYFAYAYMLFFTTLWLPGYFLSQYGLDLKSVGWYLTIPWLAAVVFLKAGGVLSDWLYRKRVARLHVVWSSQLISAVFFYVALSDSDDRHGGVLVKSGIRIWDGAPVCIL